jgi:DNA mismatch endonuclease, patch repair protein
VATEISPERSAIMRAVKQKNTGPEMAVRKLLYSMGFRYRLHRRNLPGSPDIVLAKRKIVVFVHGCFWHRHPGCKRASYPKANEDYWEPKFASNVQRDKSKERQLEELGWRVVTIWECQTQEPENLRLMLAQLLGASSERD